MLASQVLNGIVESAANQALSWADNSPQALLKMQGKTCIIHLQELQHVMCLVFSDTRIEVLGDEANYYTTMPEDMQDNECWVSVSIFALDKLKHNNQMTKLIKSGQLDFAGDLSILQALSGFFNHIDLDIESILSRYIGDPAAYQINSTGKAIVSKGLEQFALFTQTLSDAALDEKPVGVRHIMLVNFADEVNQLRADTERVEALLSRYEERIRAQQSKLKQPHKNNTSGNDS